MTMRRAGNATFLPKPVARRVRKLGRGSLGRRAVRFAALVVVEGGLLALVVRVSRRAEPVRARVVAGAAASLEGVGDPRPPPRTGGPAPAARPTLTRADRALLAALSRSLVREVFPKYVGRPPPHRT